MAYEEDDDFDADRYESAYRWEPKDPYAKLREKARQEMIRNDPGVNPLLHLTGKDVMEMPGAAPPVPLFGELWFEGDIAVMFADTGNGKSTFGVQIAESIARGIPIPPFKHRVEPQSVLYVDFEMPLSQFQNRYGGREPGHYTFSENFTRADPRFYCGTPEVFASLADHMRWAMGQSMHQASARVVIVDHISFFDLVSTQDAMRMRSYIRKLRRDRNASILLIAHTPKRRHRSPLTLNDLHGSKMLSNFADSMFAIGRCGRDVRYIKHIKSRFTATRFDSERVIAYRLTRTPGPPTLGTNEVETSSDDSFSELPPALDPAAIPELSFDGVEVRGGLQPASDGKVETDAKPNFMAFDLIGYAPEEELISGPYKNSARESLIARARDLHLAGVSMSRIASQLNVSKATVGRYCLGTGKPETKVVTEDNGKAPNRESNDGNTGRNHERNDGEIARNQKSELALSVPPPANPKIIEPPPDPKPDKPQRPPFRSQGF